MTVDERLDRLTERHETLAQSLEMLPADVRDLTADVRQLTKNMKRSEAMLDNLMLGFGAIAELVRRHELASTAWEGA